MTERWMSTAAALHRIEQSGVETGIAVDQLLNALRSGDVRARATQLVEKITQRTTLASDLTADFWNQGQILSRTLSTMKLPRWCEWNGQRSDDGWIAMDIAVCESDVDRVWAKRHAEKGAVGRPPADMWAEVAAEAFRIAYEDGIPATQAELVRRLQQTCSEAIGETQLKAFSSKLVKAIRLIEKQPAE